MPCAGFATTDICRVDRGFDVVRAPYALRALRKNSDRRVGHRRDEGRRRDGDRPGHHDVVACERPRYQPVGGAISSSPFCLASGPSCVTETAAISRTMASATNTAVSPQPVRIQRMAGTMPAVARRPTPAAQPKPDARALVGNTSDAKICIELPATWMQKIITKPATSSWVSVAAFANTIAISPAATNAQTEVILRPM